MLSFALSVVGIGSQSIYSLFPLLRIVLLLAQLGKNLEPDSRGLQGSGLLPELWYSLATMSEFIETDTTDAVNDQADTKVLEYILLVRNILSELRSGAFQTRSGVNGSICDSMN